MHARTLGGKIDQIINLLKLDLLIPAQKWIQRQASSEEKSKVQDLVSFTEKIIKRLEVNLKNKNKYGMEKCLKILSQLENPVQYGAGFFAIRDLDGDYPYISTQRYQQDNSADTRRSDFANALRLIKDFSNKLHASELVGHAQQDLTKREEIFEPSHVESMKSQELRQKFFPAFSIELAKKDFEHSLEVVIDAVTCTNYCLYLEDIKNSIRRGDIKLDEQYPEKSIIGKKLFEQLSQFADGKNDKILGMKPEQFVIIMLKTAFDSEQGIRFWNETEKGLLEKTIKIVKDVKIIPRNEKDGIEKFDAIIINEQRMGSASSEETRFDYYKEVLKKELVPALLCLNENYPQGFVLVIPYETFSAFNPRSTIIPKDFVLAFKHLLHDLKLSNLRAYVAGVELKQDFTTHIVNQMPDNSPRYPMVAMIPGHALAKPGFAFDESSKTMKETLTAKRTTILSPYSKTEKIKKKDAANDVNDTTNKSDDSDRHATNFARRIHVVSHHNETYTEVAACKNMFDSSSQLYQKAYALIHSPDFDYNEMQKARLCEMYLDMAKSSNPAECAFARDIAPYFSYGIIAKYRSNFPVIYLVHDLSKELTTVDTKYNKKKKELINYLNNLFTDPAKEVSMEKLYEHLNSIRCNLHSKEWISFWHHNLRHLLDKYCDKLKKEISKTEIKPVDNPADNIVNEFRYSLSG